MFITRISSVNSCSVSIFTRTCAKCRCTRVISRICTNKRVGRVCTIRRYTRVIGRTGTANRCAGTID